MNAKILGLLVVTMLLSGCGGWRDSIANPRNWFDGQSRSVEVPEDVNPLLPRQSRLTSDRDEDLSEPIEIIRDLVVEQTPSGAIVRAEGLANRQGAFQAELRRDEDEADGVMSFSFRIVYPRGRTPVGSEATRLVRAAASVSTQDLRSVSVIRVVGAENARETRRR